MFDQPNQSSDPQQDPSTTQPPQSVQQVTDPSVPAPSYVDAYVPPTLEEVSGSVSANEGVVAMSPEPTTDVSMEPTQSPTPPPSPQVQQSSAPHTTDTTDTADAPDAASSDSSELLEDQNIFDLLGIQDATENEKELFLDELQQVIWEDFVENDVELLLTEAEMTEFRALSEKADVSEDDKQSQMIEYLEKLVPDLEKIMLEKALELKEEMTRERIAEMKEVFQSDDAKRAEVEKAQSQADAGQWRAVATTLNALRE